MGTCGRPCRPPLNETVARFDWAIVGIVTGEKIHRAGGIFLDWLTLWVTAELFSLGLLDRENSARDGVAPSSRRRGSRPEADSAPESRKWGHYDPLLHALVHAESRSTRRTREGSAPPPRIVNQFRPELVG